jgi:4-hydroxy-tetrahydrodipicolinate reductase
MKQLARRHLRLVCGTTGLDADDIGALKRYARTAAVVYDTNMSVGITVLKQVLGATHAMLGDDFDTEIIESHHRHKRDAPSGTALALAREIAGANETVFGRGKRRTRKQGTVNIHSVRAGGIPGDHSIVFSSEEEVLTLSHRALSRIVFARGALRAARFLASRSSGFYSMKDVLE